MTTVPHRPCRLRTTYPRLLALCLGLGLAMRLILAAILPPGYDESYYLFYGRPPKPQNPVNRIDEE